MPIVILFTTWPALHCARLIISNTMFSQSVVENMTEKLVFHLLLLLLSPKLSGDSGELNLHKDISMNNLQFFY